jgi:SNF2 family DNA or RNA helicase
MNGHKAIYIPDDAFDFQKEIIDRCMRHGRYAGFIDTGLGKTLIELAIAQNYAQITNKRVLIITPLAVAFQFIDEASKFGICDPRYSKDGSLNSDVVICNYERLDKFNPDDFDTVILDESSILKNYDGKIKAQVTAFLKRVKYRYLFTATPSPNDFIELGTSSEALGYLGYTDMLGKFFTNNEDTIKPVNMGAKWVLKGHAEESFYEWVSRIPVCSGVTSMMRLRRYPK